MLTVGLMLSSKGFANDLDAAHAALYTSNETQRDDAQQVLQTAAAENNQAALMILASAAYNGVLNPAGEQTALSYWHQAAKLGNATAMFNAGLLLLERAERRDTALALLTDAAENGEPLACFVLGNELSGINNTAAIEWFRCAAEAGYPPAQYNLAVSLQARAGNAAELAEVRRWYQAASVAFAPAADQLAALPPPSLPPSAAPADEISPQQDDGIHEQSWVMARNPEHFTIQVAAGRSSDALVSLLQAAEPAVVSAWFLHRPGAIEPYSAVVGDFSDFQTAQTWLDDIPESLQRNQPWIRKFATLQSEIADSGERMEATASP